MKYYIIAGEASGDLHASNLVKELIKLNPNSEFRGWGGDLMQAQGVTLVKHYRELAFMGFAEVIKHLPVILKNIKFCKKDILDWKPDVIILVDYPGFNLRIAKFAKAAGFKIVYYVSPQVWAWKSSRVHLIKEVVDKMLVIFPFEESFYARYNYKVDFVGHPLLDVIDNSAVSATLNARALSVAEMSTSKLESTARHQFLTENNLPDKPIVGLLPGSRHQEIENMLPVFNEVAKKFPDYHFVIAGAPSAKKEWYAEFINTTNVSIIYDKTYQLLSHANAALVTSGTATMEAALWGVPEAVCYKTKGVTGTISYHLAKRLIGKKLKFIAIVNLVMEREVVKEFIQHEMNADNLTAELQRLLEDTAYCKRIKHDYKEIKEKLGGPGASAKAAKIIYDLRFKI